VWWALRPAAPAWRRWVTAVALIALAAVAVKNGVTFYRVWHEGLIDPWLGVPFSLVLAVVLGAQVHPDGTPSPTLAARVRAAVRLYKEGQAAGLLMSGARGVEEPSNETAVMRALAIAQGVPASAISVDPAGFNTDASVRDTVPMVGRRGYTSVAVVTDYFHLPRVKLAYQRAGLDVITVPSRGPEPPMIVILREIPAFWVYYLRAIL
jgi:vancomycin permeability regulator SanA